MLGSRFKIVLAMMRSSGFLQPLVNCSAKHSYKNSGKNGIDFSALKDCFSHFFRMFMNTLLLPLVWMASANLNDCPCLSPDSLAADSRGLPINKPLKSRLGKISWQHVLRNMLTSQEKTPCSLMVKLAVEQIAFTVCIFNIDFLRHTIILLWFHLKSDHSDWNQNKSLWIEQLGFSLRTPICLFFFN